MHRYLFSKNDGPLTFILMLKSYGVVVVVVGGWVLRL